MICNICLYLMMYLILRIYIYINVKKIHTKKVCFDKYFLIVHVSLNLVLTNLKSLVAVDDIYIKGTVSQNFVLILSFNFTSKNR